MDSRKPSDDDNNSADTEWGRAIEKPKVAARGEQASPCGEEEDDSVDIAIVGGGLVGLAVAIGLLNKDSSTQTTTSRLRAKVFERAPELRSKSQGILAIHPNGMNGLESIDPAIPQKIASVGCERHVRIVTNIHQDGTVEEITEDTGTESMEKYGRVAVGITWHNCQQVLASLVHDDENDNAVIVTSRSLSYFVEDENSVRLHFENGSIVKAKILLACDGVFSVARRQLYPKDSPIYFGQLNWGTVIPTNKLPPNVHPTNGVHYFQHKGEPPRWMSMLSDGGSGWSFWQFRVSDPKQSMQLSGNHGRGGLGLPGIKKNILPIAKKSCDVVTQAIQAIPEEQIFERSIVGHSPLPTWLSSGGRVALVGDSAHGMHPNIAQGANSAFESAAAIVQALRHATATTTSTTNGVIIDDNVLKEALRSYESARKPRVDVVQRFANILGVFQSTGKNPFQENPAVMGQTLEWIRSGSDPRTTPLPDGVSEILSEFDPCLQEGVSRLWE